MSAIGWSACPAPAARPGLRHFACSPPWPDGSECPVCGLLLVQVEDYRDADIEAALAARKTAP